EAARIDDDEASTVPLCVRVETVARRVRAILDHGRPLTDDAIEERALADVRPADHGNDRETNERRHGAPGPQAAPEIGPEIGPAPRVGSEVVRPAGVAALASAAAAMAPAFRRAFAVPNSSRIRSATAWRSSIGVDVPPVTPTMRAP